MPFVTIVAPRYAQDAPASTDLFADIVGDLNYLNANQNAPGVSLGVPNVVNGSFELDANGTVQPTGWNFVAGTGGSGAVDNTVQNDGAQSYKVVQGTAAGNTGGVLTGPYNGGNQYYTVSPQNSYMLRFMLKNNRADITNTVTVFWYNSTGGSVGSTVFSAIGSSARTTWIFYSFIVTPPSNAYYCQLQFSLGNNSVTPPGATGNIWVDGISFLPRPLFWAFATIDNDGATFTVPAGVNMIKIWIKNYSNVGNNIVAFGPYVAINTFPGEVFTFSFNFGNFTFTSNVTGQQYKADGTGMQMAATVMPVTGHNSVILY